MKIICIAFFSLVNLTLSINASSFVDERIETDAKESSGFVTFNVYTLVRD